jgi:hypothetical protein
LSFPTKLELAGKGAFAASLIAYLVGFLVAVPHYVKHGVPVEAIAHQNYLVVGISWLVVTCSLWLVGTVVRLIVRGVRVKGEWSYDRTLAVVQLSVMVLLSFSFVHSLLGPLTWWKGAFVAMSILVVPDIVAIEFSRSPIDNVWRAVWAASVLAGHIASYSSHVFPSVPVHYGGAPLQLIASLRLSGDGKVAAEHDRWAEFTCRDSVFREASFLNGCRRIFSVYQSHEHLYLLVEERPELCRADEEIPSSSDPNTCLFRIAQDRLPQLEVPGPKRPKLAL